MGFLVQGDNGKHLRNKIWKRGPLSVTLTAAVDRRDSFADSLAVLFLGLLTRTSFIIARVRLSSSSWLQPQLPPLTLSLSLSLSLYCCVFIICGIVQCHLVSPCCFSFEYYHFSSSLSVCVWVLYQSASSDKLSFRQSVDKLVFHMDHWFHSLSVSVQTRLILLLAGICCNNLYSPKYMVDNKN